MYANMSVLLEGANQPERFYTAEVTDKHCGVSMLS